MLLCQLYTHPKSLYCAEIENHPVLFTSLRHVFIRKLKTRSIPLSLPAAATWSTTVGTGHLCRKCPFESVSFDEEGSQPLAYLDFVKLLGNQYRAWHKSTICRQYFTITNGECLLLDLPLKYANFLLNFWHRPSDVVNTSVCFSESHRFITGCVLD